MRPGCPPLRSNNSLAAAVVAVVAVVGLEAAVVLADTCYRGEYRNATGYCQECPCNTFSEVLNATSCYSCPVGGECTTGRLKVLQGYYVNNIDQSKQQSWDREYAEAQNKPVLIPCSYAPGINYKSDDTDEVKGSCKETVYPAKNVSSSVAQLETICRLGYETYRCGRCANNFYRVTRVKCASCRVDNKVANVILSALFVCVIVTVYVLLGKINIPDRETMDEVRETHAARTVSAGGATTPRGAGRKHPTHSTLTDDTDLTSSSRSGFGLRARLQFSSWMIRARDGRAAFHRLHLMLQFVFTVILAAPVTFYSMKQLSVHELAVWLDKTPVSDTMSFLGTCLVGSRNENYLDNLTAFVIFMLLMFAWCLLSSLLLFTVFPACNNTSFRDVDGELKLLSDNRRRCDCNDLLRRLRRPRSVLLTLQKHLILLILLGYPFVSFYVFLGLLPEPYNTSVLLADYRTGWTGRNMIAQIILCVIWILGCPLYIFVVFRYWKRRLGDSADAVRYLGFLHEAYREPVSYWFVLDMMRLLGYAACGVFRSLNVESQRLAFFTIVSFIWLLLHVIAQPYRRKIHNDLQTLQLSTVVMLFWLTSVSTPNSDFLNNKFFSRAAPAFLSMFEIFQFVILLVAIGVITWHGMDTLLCGTCAERSRRCRDNTARRCCGEDDDDDRTSKSELNGASEAQPIEISPESLTLGTKIAAGGSGQVFQARMNNVEVAAKEIFSTAIAGDISEFIHEANMLSRLRHPHVLTMYGTCFKDERWFIVTEFAPRGSLESVIDALSNVVLRSLAQGIPEPELYKWARQIASGMDFLHSQANGPIVHRDLKPGNVLINRANDALIADVGLAQGMDDQWLHLQGSGPAGDFLRGTSSSNTEASGTPAYMAPEVIRCEEPGPPADVWAYGATMVRLITLDHPFGRLAQTLPQDELLSRVASENLRPELRTRRRASIDVAGLNDIVSKCLRFKPEERPTFKEICSKLTALSAIMEREPMRPSPEPVSLRISQPGEERRQQIDRRVTTSGASKDAPGHRATNSSNSAATRRHRLVSIRQKKRESARSSRSGSIDSASNGTYAGQKDTANPLASMSMGRLHQGSMEGVQLVEDVRGRGSM